MQFKSSNDYLLLQTKLMFSVEHQLVIALLTRYLKLDRATTAETALAEYVFDNIDAQALTILSVGMIHGRRAPIQTLIGTVASALLNKNLDSGKVIATYQCVAEFIMASPELYKMSTAFFGGSKCECLLYDTEAAKKKLFQLPSFNEPTKQHRALGRFQWEITNKDAIDKLNKVAMTLLPFEEMSVPPEGSEDRVKYDIRAMFRPVLTANNTPMYFNWHSDYRGRMYAGGEMLASL